MVDACGVVVATARGVRERVVCVVNLLEFTSTLSAFGGVGGYAVGVGAEGCSGGSLDIEGRFKHWSGILLLVGIANLLLGCCGGYAEGGICVVDGQ
jgi:hypothetical protein